MNSSAEEFIKLREAILDQAVPLLDSDTIAPEDRFRLSLQTAQIKGSIDAYNKAFQIAEKMEGDDKLRAYMDLLNEVDYVIDEKQGANETTTVETAASAENLQPAESTSRVSEAASVSDQ